MGRILCLLLLLILPFGASGCGPTGFISPKPYKETRFLMDTIIEITAYGSNAEEAVKFAFGEFEKLHKIANQYDENSQISEINRNAGIKPVTVDDDIISMLDQSFELTDKLGGVFDVTIGPLTVLWGVGNKGDYIPTQAEIEQVLPLVNYKLVKVDRSHRTVYLPQPGMRLDMGAVAKGYAIDKAIAALKAKGIKSALVNAGGDVGVIGKKPDGQSWRIGVQSPRKQDGIAAKLTLDDSDTLRTSGDYQRYIMVNNIRYAHILDPKTGRQPQEVASITLVLHESAKRNAFSAAFFVLGADQGLEALKQFPGVDAIIVTTDGQIVTTPGLTGKVELVKE